jgi:DNA-directed RNA polymerase subunit N (RpoN/RPB10)
MRRAIYCVARGGASYTEMALGLARSLQLIGDTHLRILATDIPGVDWKRYFHQVVDLQTPRSALDKLFALETTDADAVLALDVDMLAFRPLDSIFAAGSGRPFVVQGFWETEGNFHRRPIAEILARYPNLTDAFPRFNGGLIYYERSEVFARLLEAFRRAEEAYDALGFERFRRSMPSEEVCVLEGMMRNNYVDLFPMETQFQHSLSGPIGPVRVDILKGECQAVCKVRRGVELARPILWHAWRYKDYTLYWNQLRALRRVEEIAERRPPEYVTPFGRLRRSIERRWVEQIRRYR